MLINSNFYESIVFYEYGSNVQNITTKYYSKFKSWHYKKTALERPPKTDAKHQKTDATSI
jgi:hypothetical protein